MVGRNVVANYLGRGWTGVLGLAFIPVYVHFLGIEAYGLIGVFAVIQAWLTLLDLGLTPTLNREMARFTAGAHDAGSIRDLLRSVEVVCFALAVAMAAAIWLLSDWLARDWLNSGDLSVAVVAEAVSIMAVVVALRFCEGIYRGALYGLQRQVWYNTMYAGLSTLRHTGAVVVVALILPTIQAFFLWQAAVSLLTLAVYATKVNRLLPRPPRRPRFSVSALAGVSRFAGGMMAITALTLALTTLDKVLLSRLLQLDHFGYYALAASVGGALFMLTGPVAEAVYPRMVELATRHDERALASLYHTSAQLITVLTAPTALVLSFFAPGVIWAWSGDPALAAATAPILSALVLGTFLNGLMWIPYRCQLAFGWTGLVVRANLVAVALLVPAIVWAVPRHGAVGAAWAWVALNAGYVLILTHFMHRRILPGEKWRWYARDAALPTGAALAVLLLAAAVQPHASAGRLTWVFFLAGAGGVSLLASLLAAGAVRRRVREALLGGAFLAGLRSDARSTP